MAEIDVREERGVRTLHFGSEWIQGAMRIARPWHLELEYTREMMACLLFRDLPQFPERALLVGLGTASLAKFLFRHFPQTRITVVEIDPAVIGVARQFFRLPEESARFRIVVEDGADYMVRKGARQDLILVDGFDANARPGQLDTVSFYQACAARLTNQGILAVNLFGRSRGYRRSLERIEQAFAGRCVAFPPCESGNVIAFASAGEEVITTLSELKSRASSLRQCTGLDLKPTLGRLAGASCCKKGLLTF